MFSASLLIPVSILPIPPFFFVQNSTSNEGHSTARRKCILAHVAVCAGAAPPTQLLSRERAGPSNSERKSEQEAEILLRAGERGMGKETGGGQGRGAGINK